MPEIGLKEPALKSGVNPWIFWAVFVAIAIYACAPVWISPMLLGSDTPNHAARIHILANLNRIPELREFYSSNWHAVPNLGLDLVLVPLAKWVAVPTLFRCFICACYLLLGSAISMLNRQSQGGFTWIGLAGIALSHNYVTLFGFWNFTFSIGVALWGFWLWRHTEGHLRRQIAVLLIFIPTLWCIHLIGCVLLLAMIATGSFRQLRLVRSLGFSYVAMVAISGWATLLTRATHGGNAPYYLSTKFRLIQGGLAFGWDLSPLLVLATLAALITAWCVNHRGRKWPIGWLAFCIILLPFVGPHMVNGSHFASTRMGIVGLLILCTTFGRLSFELIWPNNWRERVALVGTTLSVLAIGLFGLRYSPLGELGGQPVHVGTLVKRGGLVYYAAYDWEFLMSNRGHMPATLHSNCEAIFERPVYLRNLFAFDSQQPVQFSKGFQPEGVRKFGQGDVTIFVLKEATEALRLSRQLGPRYLSRPVYLYVAKPPGHPLGPTPYRKIVDSDQFALLQLQ